MQPLGFPELELPEVEPLELTPEELVLAPELLVLLPPPAELDVLVPELVD